MKREESIDRALRSPEPVNSLRSLVKDLFSQGKDKAAVLAMFEDARQAMRQAGRDADEDAILDVMDFLVGWCSPHMRLEPDDPEKRAGSTPLLPENGRQIRAVSQEHPGP